MKPEAQILAIAGQQGFTNIHVCEQNDTLWGDFSGQLCGTLNGVFTLIPDYLNDLNAMREAVVSRFCYLWSGSTLWALYMKNLRDIVARNRHPDSVQFDFDVANATAAQCAEAFLRTLNRWKP